MVKIITVFGATGKQGGSVAESLLKNSNFKVRAITRNTTSQASQDLQKKGAELVKLDVTTASVDDLTKAIQGSYGVFLVTDYYAYFDQEAVVGKKIVDATIKAKVEHLIFTPLPNAEKITGGKIKVPHFDLKDDIKLYIEEQVVKHPELTATYVYVPFYYQNFETYFVPKKGDDGTYTVTMPQDITVPLAMVDITNLGPLTLALLSANKSKHANQSIPIYNLEKIDDIITKLSKASGKSIKYNFVPPSVFETFGFPGAKELADMFDFYNKYGMFSDLDQSIAPSLVKVSTFDDYLNHNQSFYKNL